ncbi:major facilitator superfamily domain-containing protein [Flagelloscypha sp. PMI_526]|nr:major facilitator superfamily domain-containing protein [Flagelloscypha sp. PMI_526]
MSNELATLPVPPAEINDPSPESSQPKSRKGRAFWLSLCSLLLATFLGALDLTVIGTMLPKMSKDLRGTDNFAWIGTAYVLAGTAFLPLSGNLADIFGRRSIMLIFLALFALGSALAGSAQSMTWLIGARTVQGMGSGGMFTLADIIISDLVPLSERGLYQGLFHVTWAFASVIGPLIGGSLAERASWRWLFYLNLPLTGIAGAFVFVFLRVRTPSGSIKSKLAAVDWIGNLIIVAGTAVSNIGLSWAGVRYSWSDVHVLAPLIVGLTLTCIFIVYQRYVPSQPTVPGDLVSNRTSLSGLVGTFVHGILSISIVYYLPVYFQAVLGATPVQSGVDILPTALLVAPMALGLGVAVQAFQRYLAGNCIGWVFSIVGFGVLSLLKAETSTGQWIGYQFIVAIGVGILYAATVFPILAPLPVERAAAALSLQNFVRSFGETWGITITGTILQNQLKKSLPPDFTAQFPSGVEVAFSAIEQIPSIPEPLQSEIKVAFAGSMSIIWKVMIGISGIGLLSVLPMKEIPLSDVVDANYALEEAVPAPHNEEKPVDGKELAMLEKV